MLTDLTIRNIAIIDSIQISLKPGLTVLTGETGAGKSIIIDAVGLVLGGRASTDLIRSGEDEAVVEALFDLTGHEEIRLLLDEAGLPCEDELIIKRSVSRAGKNRIFINGSMATLALLADISRRLINIYGQHESQTLLRPENQLMLLDRFGGTTGICCEVADIHQRLSRVTDQLEHLENMQREADRKNDLLSYQSAEISAAHLRSGEDEELDEQRHVLASAEKLAMVSAEAFERLYGGDGALLGQLQRITSSLRDIAAIDRTLDEPSAALEQAYLHMDDAAIILRDYASRIESDPALLQTLDDRLHLIGRLKKKYGATIEEILLFKEHIDRELAELQGLEQERQGLLQEREVLTENLRRLGSELTLRRTDAAASLSAALATEIHQLAMKNALVEIALIPLDEPRASGYERIEFLFSPNPGEVPRPLARIASGGELSRIMLALKQVLPESDVPTLIFDEVDTGIGGATSELVGKKLKRVADRQQVLCITHLPQVAVFADHHLRVEKNSADGRTSTRLVELSGDDRNLEVARMLAGTTISATALQHAGELLASARHS